MSDNDSVEACIFCNIISKQTPADIVHETEEAVFFRDISPKAAVHVLGVPKRHIGSLADMTAEDQTLLGKIIHDVTLVARELNISESGYRLVINVGADAGQEVHHLHVHILGGQQLSPLRC